MVLTILGKLVPCLGPFIPPSTHQVPLPGYLVDDRSKVGGSIELHCAQALEVALQNAFNSRTVGVLIIVVLLRKRPCWAEPTQAIPRSALIPEILPFFHHSLSCSSPDSSPAPFPALPPSHNFLLLDRSLTLRNVNRRNSPPLVGQMPGHGV